MTRPSEAPRPLSGLFVAGTGTDVGKTVVTAALLRALSAVGVRAQAVKVVQTGVAPEDAGTSPLSDQRVYADALAVPVVRRGGEGAAARPVAPATLHCFRLPASPHLASAREGIRLDVAGLAGEIRRLWAAGPAECLLLEGAGGLAVPLNEHEDMLDLMAALDLPLVLVARNELGGLNHTLLSLDAARGAGLRVGAVVLVPASDPSAGCPGADAEGITRDNAAVLRRRLARDGRQTPLAVLPRLERLDAAGWERLAARLAPVADSILEAGAPHPLAADGMVRRDHEVLWHPYASATRPPRLAAVARTRGNRLILSDGRELVDGMSSWWAAVHGYNHPRLMAALRGQAGRMPHVMFGGLTHEPAIALAEELRGLLPGALRRVFFADSGSVAVEVALKMALQCQMGRGQPQRTRFLAPRGGYHGDTLGAMSVCDPVNGMHALFAGTLARQIFVERPACRFDQPFDPASLDPMRQALAAHGAEIAAVILEPVVQGAGGMWFYHPEYLRGLAQLCRKAGALLIFDEIATGFGRTGKMFAAEWADAAPDILCCGKALTGGVMTLAATACTDEVARDICRDGRVFMHGPTFMANPLACSVALASLDLLRREDWRGGVAALQEELAAGLAPCAGMPGVADVRVLGGIGVVETEQPVDAENLHGFFVERGVWLRPFNRLVYLMPPYMTPRSDVKRLCAAVREALLQGAHMPRP